MPSSIGGSTTYGGGGQTIKTTGGTRMPSGGGFGGGGVNLAGLANQRAGQLLQKGSLENQMYQFQLEEAKRGARAARRPSLGTWDSPQGMSNRQRRYADRQAGAQTRMLEAQANAMTQAAPTKMLFGPGIVPGRTMDTNAMSGAQRQMFLPQNSGFGGTPSGSEAFSMTRGQQAGQSAAEIDQAMQLRGMMQGGQLPGVQNWGWHGAQSPQGRSDRQTSIEDAYQLWLMKARSGQGGGNG